jgi:hypothetical protein
MCACLPSLTFSEPKGELDDLTKRTVTHMGSLVKETPYSEITATLEVLDRYHITRDHLGRLRSDQDYAKYIAESMLAGETDVFRVSVNYDLSVEEMIKAGKYDQSSYEITSKNFPSSRTGTSEGVIQLVRFDGFMESKEVLRELEDRELRPANLPELLALGAQHPYLQRKFPIVALGLFWHGGRVVACLWGDHRKRGLGFDWLGIRWDGLHRFAAVHKVSPVEEQAGASRPRLQ